MEEDEARGRERERGGQNVGFLTEFDEALAELKHANEAAILRVGCTFQRRECDGEELFRRVEH